MDAAETGAAEIAASDCGFDFADFFTKFNANIDLNLKELCVTKSVIKPDEFFKNLEQMQSEIAQRSPKTGLGTVEEYAELFKQMDTYPSNLQRLPKKRELQRANSVILKGNDATLDQTAINTSSASLKLSMLRLDEQPSAAEIYRDYKKFQQELRQIYDEAAALNKEQSTYLAMTAQLQNFSQQLEKQMPTECEVPDAFTSTEEAKLIAIAENLKQLNYIRANSLLHLTNPSQTTVARLEILVDVLTNTLMQISCYNNV